MDVKDFMETTRKYSNNDWVKCSGYVQGEQKDRPTAYILSSVRGPLPSEAVAALRTASMMSVHLFTL